MIRCVRYAKLGLLAVATLGLIVWPGYALVVGIIGGSAGRVGAGVGAAVGLAAAVCCGAQFIRLARAEGNCR